MSKVLFWLGALWSLPTSLLGLLLAIAGGARPYALRPAVAWHWVPWGFWWAWWYRPGSPWGAITFGHVTIIGDAQKDNPIVIRHERAHLLQTHLLGPFFVPLYVLEWAIAGFNYFEIPLEVAAYEAQSSPDKWG